MLQLKKPKIINHQNKLQNEAMHGKQSNRTFCIGEGNPLNTSGTNESNISCNCVAINNPPQNKETQIENISSSIIYPALYTCLLFCLLAIETSSHVHLSDCRSCFFYLLLLFL